MSSGDKGKKKKVLLLLLIAFYIFPLDISMLMVQSVGWTNQWILFLIIVIAIWFTTPGDTFKLKVTHIKQYIKGMFK